MGQADPASALLNAIGNFIADQMQAGSLLLLDQLTAEQEAAVWGVIRGRQTLDLLVNVEALFPALGIVVPKAPDAALPVVEKKPWDEHPAILKPLSKRDFSNRIVDVLRDKDIVYLGEVACYIESELLTFNNLGRKLVRQLKEILASHGLSLGMFPEGQRAAIRAAAEANAAKSG